jgi:uncharacterized membrane protein
MTLTVQEINGLLVALGLALGFAVVLFVVLRDAMLYMASEGHNPILFYVVMLCATLTLVFK